MRQQVSCKTIYLTLVLALGLTLLPVAPVEAQKGKKQQQRTEQSDKQQSSKQQTRALTASQAAARAKAQYGGKVLKVSPSGNG